MEFITSAVLSGFLYDMLKHGVSITAEGIKEKLKDWVLDDTVTTDLAIELGALDLNDDLSESAIEKIINRSPKLFELLSSIKKEGSVTTVIQNHNGTGDNIGRNKITK
jgi:hypothetical protein